jgi:hypothetical protein
LNAKKEAIYGATAQTWHQVRPGEHRTCGGCHTHWQKTPFDFAQTFAATAEYVTPKLDRITTIEYGRDLAAFLNLADPATAAKGYDSAISTVDDNPSHTAAQQELIRAWIDTGLMVAGTHGDGSPILPAHGVGPYADTVPPTLTVQAFADRILIGACDPQAGLNEVSLSVKASVAIDGIPAGDELANQFTKNGDVWTLMTAVPPCTLTVSIRDQQKATNSAGVMVSEDGNLTRVVRTFTSLETPPEPDPCEEQLAALRAQVAGLQLQLSTANATITSLQADVAALKAKLQQIHELSAP